MCPSNLSNSISVVATSKNNRYDISDGTSFASPCVAAAIATIKSIHYDYLYTYIESRLKETAIPP